MDSELTEVEEVRDLMVIPKPDDHLRYWPVSTLVNSIRNNGVVVAQQMLYLKIFK